MKPISERKLKRICKKQGRIEEYEKYKASKGSLEGDIIRYRNTLNQVTQKLINAQQMYSENSKEYREAKDEVYRWQQTLEDRCLQLKFVRPNSQEDIEYRDNLCDNFPSRLQAVLSPDLDLRFHGTSIYFAEQIIKKGAITSTADRYDGYIKSTDMKGEISVTNGKTIGRTINFFSDMVAYNRSMPAGCIFAVLPKDKEDANYGYDLMHSVDFHKNPEQFFGVITTPENIQQVKEWMDEARLNSSAVYTFDEFIEVVKEKSNSIEGQAKSNGNSTNHENRMANNLGINHERSNQQSYLFDQKDAKEMVMQRRTGMLAKLQEKMKNVLTRFKTKDERGGTRDDGGARD